MKRYEQQKIKSIESSNSSHQYWKKHFHTNALYFEIFAEFEADKGIDFFSIGDKTTNFFKYNPVCNG